MHASTPTSPLSNPNNSRHSSSEGAIRTFSQEGSLLATFDIAQGQPGSSKIEGQIGGPEKEYQNPGEKGLLQKSVETVREVSTLRYLCRNFVSGDARKLFEEIVAKFISTSHNVSKSDAGNFEQVFSSFKIAIAGLGSSVGQELEVFIFECVDKQLCKLPKAERLMVIEKMIGLSIPDPGEHLLNTLIGSKVCGSEFYDKGYRKHLASCVSWLIREAVISLDIGSFRESVSLRLRYEIVRNEKTKFLIELERAKALVEEYAAHCRERYEHVGDKEGVGKNFEKLENICEVMKKVFPYDILLGKDSDSSCNREAVRGGFLAAIDKYIGWKLYGFMASKTEKRFWGVCEYFDGIIKGLREEDVQLVRDMIPGYTSVQEKIIFARDFCKRKRRASKYLDDEGNPVEEF